MSLTGDFGGLDAAIRGGWEGLAQYMAQTLQRALVDNLSSTLARLLSPDALGNGGLFGKGGIASLIRMPPGSRYPRHRHLGEERFLMLQGGVRFDDGSSADAGWACATWSTSRREKRPFIGDGP